MAIRGATTIAEYAIRKWMEREGSVTECFELEMTGAHEAVLHDGNGDRLRLLYDRGTRMVLIVE